MQLSLAWSKWARAFLCGLCLFTFAWSASANTIDDSNISEVSEFSLSSTTVAEQSTMTVTFTVDGLSGKSTAVQINAQSVDCQVDWEDCRLDFSNVETSDISGFSNIDGVYGDDGGYLAIYSNESGWADGEYTIEVDGVVNSASDSAQRVFMYTSESSACISDGWCATKSDPFLIGDFAFFGTVTGGSNTWGHIHTKKWDEEKGFNTDEWGFYAIPAAGLSAGSLTMSLYPNTEETGYANTNKEVEYDGTPTEYNFTLDAATKTLAGTVTYKDSGLPVDSASVCANSTKGTGACENTDVHGEFTMTLSGGQYDVCLGDAWDEDGRVEKDWYTDWEDQCQTVNFTNDDSEETETLDYTVELADARIEGVFKNPDGSFPKEGGWVSFWQDSLWFGAEVDRETGAFSVAVVGGNSGEISATSLFATSVSETTYQVQYESWSDTEQTYWDEDKVTVGAGETLDLGIISLSERDIVFTATVVDGDGLPVENIRVEGWQHNGGWTGSETDENGEAVLYVYAGDWNFRPQPNDDSGYLYTDKEYNVEFEDGDTGSATFELTRTSLSVTMNAVDSTGAPLPDLDGWAGCWSEGANFGGGLNNGTTTFGAVPGTFYCNIWTNQNSDYQSSGELMLVLEEGVNVEEDVVFYERSAKVTVYVKDQDSNLVTDANDAWVYASSNSGGWTDERLDETGVVELMVAPGTYHFGVNFQNSTQYISGWSWEDDIKVADGAEITKTLTVHSVSGSLTATLTDTEGEMVDHAWVWCGNWRELDNIIIGDFDGGRLIENGSDSGGDGVAVVGLVADHEYECGANAWNELGLISPEMQMIDLTKKDNVSTEFEFRVANASISGEVELDSSAGTEDDISDLWCNAWGESGANTWDDSRDKNFSLAAIEDTWHVWCDGYIVDGSNDRTWFHSNQDLTVKVTGPGDFGGNTIELAESYFDIPEGISDTFDATALYTLMLPDGSELTVPANAISNEGNINITADPEVHAVHTYSDSPFGVPWNFEAYDSDGVLVSGDFNSSVSLLIPYNEEILTQMGIAETSILPKQWDDSTGSWVNVSFATQDLENNTVTFELEHFSQVGLVYNKQMSSSATSTPTNLRATKRKVRTATLRWDGNGEYYKLQVKKKKRNKVIQRNKHVNKKNKKFMKKNSITNQAYRFRVKACDGDSCGDWSAYKFFRTKPAQVKKKFMAFDSETNTLSWNAVRGVVKKYNVRVLQDGEVVKNVKSKTASKVIDDLEEGVTYTFKVRARYNPDNIGAWSKAYSAVY